MSAIPSIPPLAETSFYHTPPPQNYPLWLTVIGGFFLLVTIVLAVLWQYPDSTAAPAAPAPTWKAKWCRWLPKLILAGWLIGPPVWFWFDYFFIFKQYGDFKEHFEHFKYGQEVCAKVWAGVTVFLYAIHKLQSPEKK